MEGPMKINFISIAIFISLVAGCSGGDEDPSSVNTNALISEDFPTENSSEFFLNDLRVDKETSVAWFATEGGVAKMNLINDSIEFMSIDRGFATKPTWNPHLNRLLLGEGHLTTAIQCHVTSIDLSIGQTIEIDRDLNNPFVGTALLGDWIDGSCEKIFIASEEALLVVTTNAVVTISIVDDDVSLILSANDVSGTDVNIGRILQATFNSADKIIFLYDYELVFEEQEFIHKIVSLSTETGERQRISIESISNDIQNEIIGMDINPTKNELILIESDSSNVYGISVDSGTTRVVSGELVGQGVPLIDPRQLALDIARNRALVFDNELNAIISIDLTTGDRQVIFAVGSF